MTLSMDDVPALPADVRLRVLATALDPHAPPVPDTLVPADTVDLEAVPEAVPVLDEPWPDQPGELPLDTPELYPLDHDDPVDDPWSGDPAL
ncbi:hypothetical protein [Jidongwangia harbinensis]|uniref:hypothetical protein n=1 Tax=Jidongwangia harbinensis TaxID=2878561 RepID=UPI001CDA3DFE|nr:hypothetical protein [Jidongwangia harbinensis]MCA2216643.1 hypothetical protein [Jidongwangia harbinensis]